MEKVLKTINNQKITIINNDDEKLVPIKPICLALGIAFEPQFTKLQNDEFLSSIITLSVTVAGDGKEREMVCLPLRYVFGWLFTINPNNVAPEAKEAVMQYRIECYDALYNYFTARTRTIERYNRDVLKLSNLIADARRDFATTKNRLNDLQKSFNELKDKDLEEMVVEYAQQLMFE